MLRRDQPGAGVGEGEAHAWNLQPCWEVAGQAQVHLLISEHPSSDPPTQLKPQEEVWNLSFLQSKPRRHWTESRQGQRARLKTETRPASATPARLSCPAPGTPAAWCARQPQAKGLLWGRHWTSPEKRLPRTDFGRFSHKKDNFLPNLLTAGKLIKGSYADSEIVIGFLIF